MTKEQFRILLVLAEVGANESPWAWPETSGWKDTDGDLESVERVLAEARAAYNRMNEGWTY